ncbi:lysogenization regulator HflD [Alteromonadaceae bacterium M269]|nr:lysogenization regulator HflD [Alteromonadaceae bacterium M269]
MKNFETVLALAGVCQSAALVQQIARKGQADQGAFETSIKSIVITAPDHTEEVFGSFDKLKLGFTIVSNQLGNKSKKKDAEITRYIANILGLERKLAKKPQKFSELAQRIEQIQRQELHYSLFDSNMLANLASVYVDVITPIGPRIQVSGNPENLKQQHVQNKVRACLLAGVRAAVLWRQTGGKRRHILLNRSSILKTAELALEKISHI